MTVFGLRVGGNEDVWVWAFSAFGIVDSCLRRNDRGRGEVRREGANRVFGVFPRYNADSSLSLRMTTGLSLRMTGFGRF